MDLKKGTAFLRYTTENETETLDLEEAVREEQLAFSAFDLSHFPAIMDLAFRWLQN